ncbi:MAG: ABC transporter ATP-binding protein [Lachnospiraceae bacterium]|jgi:ABC-type multidrug transport system fused ATPase/permease subunit|nr:ABC transporter ATP-binding protein [Lachnospiraceae bacterium]
MNKYFFENKRIFALYVLVTPCMAVTSVLFASSMEPLWNEVVLHNAARMQRAIGWFCLFGALDTLCFYLHKVIRENLRFAYLAGVKRDTIAGILNMDYTAYRKNPPAYYISLFQRDISRVNEDYFDSVCGIYRVSTASITTVYALVRYNPWICLLNVAIGAASVLVPKVFERRIEVRAKEASDKAADYQGILSDTLSGFNTIRIFSVVERIKQQVDVHNVASARSEKNRVVANFSVSYISMAFTMVGYIATIAIGVMMAYQGKMTAGGVMAVSQLIGGILVPFEELPGFFTNLKSVKSVNEKVLSYVQVPAQDCAPDGEELTDMRIELRDVQVRYDEDTVLKGICTTFEQNGKYMIMGESGSGKSTLAKVLLKMVPTSGGDVTVAGKSIDQISENALYRAVNYMQQEVFLFDDTIYNNITLYKDYPTEEVERVIEAVGLKAYVDSLQNGIQTVINGNGYNLSGGQKQRIGIARSLLSGAKVIVLDEITASLDMVLGKKIEDVVFGLKDVTVIWITHKITPDTMRKADDILVIRDGLVKEQGTYEQLLERKGLFYSYKTIAG